MIIDWFQPFKNRNDYSVGVIYFVLPNLPRNIRFRSENVIIAGLIPAFKNEPHSINSFLIRLLKSCKCSGKMCDWSQIFKWCICFRAALLCVSGDIPAARKCCGFKSHAGRLGCHKCFKICSGDFGEIRQNWEPRSKSLHNLYAKKVNNANSKAHVDKLFQDYGIYYSVKIELDYFDAI